MPPAAGARLSSPQVTLKLGSWYRDRVILGQGMSWPRGQAQGATGCSAQTISEPKGPGKSCLPKAETNAEAVVLPRPSDTPRDGQDSE